MIEWFDRVDPEAVFLNSGQERWTYGETLDQLRVRLSPEPKALHPGRDPESLFEILGAMSGGGAILLGPGDPLPDVAHIGIDPLVVFTSGTSGVPKGVRLTWENIETACRASIEHLGHGADDIWLTAMPLHHVGGLSAIVRSVFAGGGVRLLPGFDPVQFVHAMKSESTIVSVVPTMLQRILEHDRGPFDGLRAVLVGGGPIPDGLLERAAATGMPVLPSYGMTETFGQAATLLPGAPLGRWAHPLPGMDVRIETDGRIALRSPQISPGYLGEPDRTDAWFVTSDVGSMLDHGAISVLGRADLVIVSGGENVNPERVESVILDHPDVEAVVVVGVPDPTWGEMVVAVYTGTASEDALKEWVPASLPGFMTPKRWVRAETLPLTSIGKPDRSGARGLAGG